MMKMNKVSNNRVILKIKGIKAKHNNNNNNKANNKII